VTRWLLSLQWILWCHSGIHSFLLTALSEVISIFLKGKHQLSGFDACNPSHSSSSYSQVGYLVVRFVGLPQAGPYAPYRCPQVEAQLELRAFVGCALGSGTFVVHGAGIQIVRLDRK
jgi:hypothetical protein